MSGNGKSTKKLMHILSEKRKSNATATDRTFHRRNTHEESYMTAHLNQKNHQGNNQNHNNNHNTGGHS
jgi:ankyrin repeat protein